MVKDFKIDTVKYGGKYSKYFWDLTVNPNATLANCLANCTTAVYGMCLACGLGAPVTRISDARNWHKNLASDWEALTYSRDAVREGDIIEWDTNHVALVKDRNTIYASWYTGDHGKAYYDGGYDKRSFSSLQETSNWMVENYPYRFFHEASIEQEIRSLGDEQPTLILRKKSSGDYTEIKKALTEIEASIEKIKEAL